MYKLYDAASGESICMLSEDQLSFLIENLEEESATDRDYYINRATIDMFQGQGAEAELLTMLRNAMGDRPDMDIRWDSTPAA